ncbi:kinetochore-associated protein NSL1 homolog [Brienomyrus brachyistius]|uniref:kinetochore-associated protein NSL1 homolog n=1 Tax=Brienomyrus brachyistius TaxID=42636 RepID=UPI0020B40724|nr:kinetochore-associated protein NSL1 homolog [Brienomyrus brachyistius]
MEKEDHRIKLSSKKQACEQLRKYRELLNKVLDGQTCISEEAKQLLLEELMRNFEAGVKDNILINGETWDEAPDEDEDDDCKKLDDMLDENILETSLRRSRYPKQILPYVVRALKAERETMGLYEQAIKPVKIIKDPIQGSTVSSLSEAVPKTVRQAAAVMKSLQTVQQHAEGLRQVMATQTTAQTLELHQEVFGKLPGVEQSRDGRKRPLKRSAVEMEMNSIYVLNPKRENTSEDPQ